jgi:DNA excision repair protein ERCC-2
VSRNYSRKNPVKTIYLAITDFALPVPRTGSIETHSGYGPLPQNGQELHVLIQSERKSEFPEYEAEVQVSHTFQTAKNRFLVSGRMDGFFRRAIPRIEEIKTAFNSAELAQKLAKDEAHPYRLQLATYAYLHWLKTDQIPETVLHIVSSRTGDGVDLPILFNPMLYEIWLQRRLDELDVEVALWEKNQLRREKAGETFAFPFEKPRSGQLELIDTIETGMADNKFMLLQAPTGLGKTAGVLYPLMKDSLSRGQKVIYVTPKNSQHAVAEDAVKRFQADGSKVRSLTIHAKSKMCFKNEVICNPTYCEFARDYYEKFDQNKIRDKLAKKKRLTSKTFRKVGAEFEVCPFELQMEMADQADVVICDYNYVFSPRNALGRLAQDKFSKKKTKPNLVIDEAHNLFARAMDYFSPRISAYELERCREAVQALPAAFAGAVERNLNSAIRAIENCAPPGIVGPSRIEVDPEIFLVIESEFRSLLTRYLESSVEIQPRDVLIRLSDRWSEMTAALQLAGPEFFTTFKPAPNGGTLKVTCCDASKTLEEGYKAFHRVVGFSATMKPFDYYAKLSGLPEDVLTAEFESPFPDCNRKLLIIPQVSTKYNQRERNYGKIRDAIEKIVALKPGNYFVFFPSFDFLERVYRMVELPTFQVLKQEREMKLPDVKTFLEVLERADRPTVIFAVQGGVFAEGVDYPGDMLIGALVVGPALPSFDLEREILRDYYDQNYGSGFDYAYTYPAMAKVVQSAGRVIRSPTDKGVVILLDQRFVQDSYVKTMPNDWHRGSINNLLSQRLLADISEFWEKNESP